MEIKEFSKKFPGSLIRITPPEVAFVPDPLPPDWKFPESLWPQLSDAKQQIGILEGIGRILPNPQILLRPLQSREAIRSSSLEGTFATPQELLLFELDPREAQSDKDPVNSWLEVFNYENALRQGIASPLPLSLRLIQDLHRTLLNRVRGRDRAPGDFRRVQVHIGPTKRFIPPPPNVLLNCLDAFEKYIHTPDIKFDPLIRCYMIHYQFETIHPFVDGNGRVGRLLLAIMLQLWCGMSKPWLYMSAYFDQHKDDYIDRLFGVSSKGDWEGWISYCLDGTISQTKDTINRCQALVQLRIEYQKRIEKTKGSIRLINIIESLFASPMVKVANLARSLDVTYPTASSDIKRLMDVGILVELDNQSGKSFYAQEIIDVAYKDDP